ncbi:condensation domain-containing protein [Streptomyces kronopolitis]|uniref:condensation domain-containing protein n=1 Tax=Streptomyces kronopolitis TaxID=1612435 RepID=UPI003426E472
MTGNNSDALNGSWLADIVQRAWAHALHGELFADGDDFFACGGDSLAALAAVSEVATATGLDVPTQWLYEHPLFADAVRALAAGVDDGLAQIIPQDRTVAHPLSFQQEGLLRVMDHVRGGHRYQVAYAVELPAETDEGRLAAAVSRLGSRHPALTTRVVTDGGRARQQIANMSPILLERIRCTAPDDAETAVGQWAATTIELDEPLSRIALIKAGPRRVLALSAHQMVMDPWSWGLVVRDLAVLYDDPDAEGASPLAYSDYACWQRQHLSGAVHEHHLKHWSRVAEGYALTGVPLPGLQGDLSPAGPAARLPLVVPAEHAQALRTAAKVMDASFFEVLLSLFHLAVGRWSGTSDILVASATGSRTRPGTENVVGFFVNGRFTRTSLDGLRTFGDLIGHVRDRWRAGDAHCELHLEKVLFDLGAPDLANIKFSVNAIPTLSDLTLAGRPLNHIPVTGALSARRHISVGLTPEASGSLSGALTYRTDLLAAPHVQVLAEEFLTLCASAAHAPSSARIPR